VNTLDVQLCHCVQHDWSTGHKTAMCGPSALADITCCKLEVPIKVLSLFSGYETTWVVCITSLPITSGYRKASRANIRFRFSVRVRAKFQG